MKLFGYLPESIFQPLAGPKKHVYARLLMRLYDRVYSARILDTPLREEVVKQIEIGLAEAGIGSTDQLSEDASDDHAASQAHYLAYYRLRDTGWLTEETEKWRVYVDMNSDAFMVLGAITDFGNSRVRVAGAVVDVKNNLEAAFREPETMAQGLANAHDTAVRFARSMRRILAGMREIEDRILGNPNAASILRTFFQDFVDGLLIADYKQLKTSNNPYRHRRTITSLAGDMLADAERIGKISRAYIEQGVLSAGSTVATAEERVNAELEKIKSVFEDVGPFMDKIEDFRDRLERRIRTTVHYMDVMGEGSAERIARLIENLSALETDSVEIRLRSPDVGLPITSLARWNSSPRPCGSGKLLSRSPTPARSVDRHGMMQR
jgi:hypothetical protein